MPNKMINSIFEKKKADKYALPFGFYVGEAQKRSEIRLKNFCLVSGKYNSTQRLKSKWTPEQIW